MEHFPSARIFLFNFYISPYEDNYMAHFTDEQTEAQGMTGLVQGHTVKCIPPEKQWYKNSRHCGRVVRVIFLDQGFDGGGGKTLWAS